MQQYQPPVEGGMPMNVSMNTDGFPESVLNTNQTTSDVLTQLPTSNNINPFIDSTLIGTYLFFYYNDFKTKPEWLYSSTIYKVQQNGVPYSQGEFWRKKMVQDTKKKFVFTEGTL